MSCLRAALSQSDISRGVYTKTERTAESKVIMDVRILLTALVTLVLVAVCHATIDPDQAVQIVDDQDLESDVIGDKRAAKIFRYGRAPSVFRYGKRAPSVFRYGKRAPAVFRYGRSDDDGLMMLVEPQSTLESAGQNKRKIFRYGKRSD